MNARRLATILAPALLLTGCYVDAGGTYQDPPPPPPPPTTTTQTISQFANGATASSDGIAGSSDYSAAQAVGAPDVAACGDNPSAWSPIEANAGYNADGTPIEDWLQVSFPRYVWVRELQVVESYDPGAIVEIDLRASDGSAPDTVLWSDPAGDGFGPCPGSFVVDVNGTTDFQYDTAIVWIDTNRIGDANGNGNYADDFPEIDAVQLTGDEDVTY